MSRQRKNKTISLVDIIIPNFRRFDLLEKCLNAIPEAMGNISYRVLIWDNGSPKEEKEFYKTYTHSFEMKVFESSTNLGYPKACNYLAKRATAPLLFVLTSDVFLNKGSGDALVREMDNLDTGIVGMKLLFPEGSQSGPAGKIQHVGLAWNIRADIFHLFSGWSPDNPRVLKVRDVFAVTGAAFMTRRNLWNKIGGFNERYGLGTWEDVEYCTEVRKLGYNVIVSQQATAYHWTNATALAYGIGYPINENKNIFMSKFGKDIIWDEWRHW